MVKACAGLGAVLARPLPSIGGVTILGTAAGGPDPLQPLASTIPLPLGAGQG